MYLFLDTETTGLPLRYGRPAAQIGNWPRLVQVAWLLTDADGHPVEPMRRRLLRDLRGRTVSWRRTAILSALMGLPSRRMRCACTASTPSWPDAGAWMCAWRWTS